MSASIEIVNICRVCMKQTTGISFDNDIIIKQFEYVTQLKIIAEDGMPTTLCNFCFEQMKAAYQFKALANSTNVQLRDFMNKVHVVYEEDMKNISTVHNLETLQLNISQTEKELQTYNEENTAVECSSSYSNSDLSNCFEDNKNHEGNDLEEILFEDSIIDDSSSFAMPSSNGSTNFNENNLNDGNNSPNESNRLEHRSPNIKRSNMIKRNSILRHQLANKSFPCSTCGSILTTKNNLQRHMVKHNGKKPFHCNICGNGFTQNKSLKVHMLIHTGEKPHVCSVCSRGFTQTKSLQVHMRLHTGEKPFKCSECFATFRQKDLLKRHTVKHLNAESKQIIASRSLENQMAGN